MNGVYELNQTSGNDWSAPKSADARLYHRQKAVTIDEPRTQLTELADLERQMARHNEEHRSLVEQIRSLYVINDEVDVCGFLNRHRHLPPVLVAAEPYLRRIFKASVISLRATSDEYGWEMLYASVHWSGEPKDALQDLNAFDDEWWIANSCPAGSNLTFTYRLV